MRLLTEASSIQSTSSNSLTTKTAMMLDSNCLECLSALLLVHTILAFHGTVPIWNVIVRPSDRFKWTDLKPNLCKCVCYYNYILYQSHLTPSIRPTQSSIPQTQQPPQHQQPSHAQQKPHQ